MFVNDLRGLVVLVLSVTVSVFAGGVLLLKPLVHSGASENLGSWTTKKIYWCSTGPNGAGVYGPCNDLTSDSVLFAPRLAVFVFSTFELNHVDEETLRTIKGVGPKLANSIVDYRRAHGFYKSVDELLHVKGIGTVKLNALRSYLVVSGNN